MGFRTERKIAVSPASILAAFEDSARMATWWGPNGFTNSFEVYEFKPGGSWRYIMHGPDGKDYRNEMRVEEIERTKRIVLRHISHPCYLLTVTLVPTADGATVVQWDQEFEHPDVARRIERIVVPANEEVLDRLSAEVLGGANTKVEGKRQKV